MSAIPLTAVPKRFADWNGIDSHRDDSDVPRRLITPDAWEFVEVAHAEPEVSDTPDIIEAAIEVSRGFLSLDEDWDGEGSVGYTEETWQASVALLRDLRRLAGEQGLSLPAPRIGPAQGGSFDLHWELPRGSMLMNIESSSGHPCTYYGQTSNGSTLAGSLVSSSDLGFILNWLATPWEP